MVAQALRWAVLASPFWRHRSRAQASYNIHAMNDIDGMLGWRTLHDIHVEAALEATPPEVVTDSEEPMVLRDRPVRYRSPNEGGSLIDKRAYELSLLCLKSVEELRRKHQYELANQLVRSGTNPGAMLQELKFAESQKDKRHKLSVALKEAAETRYWICLSFDAELIEKRTFVTLIDAVNPVIALLHRERQRNEG